LELSNAAQVTQARKEDQAKRSDAFKSFQQPGRRVSNLQKSSQARVEISQNILAGALSHERSPQVAMTVVKAVAQQVEETLMTAQPANKEDEAKAQKQAEEEALAAARREEELRLQEEEQKKAREAAAAKAAADAEAAARVAEEARKAAEAAAEKEAAEKAALKRQAEEEEARAQKAKEEAEAAALLAAGEPETTPEPSVDDGAKFEMSSLSQALD
jgi:colicin import membrane protein